MSDTPPVDVSARRPVSGDERPAWAVFSGRSVVWWTRFLSPGFRHCLAVIDEGRRWLVVDPLTTRTEIRRIDRATVPDLPRRLAALGLIVVPVRARPARRPLPRRPRTCVEVVKRALGIDAPSALTPRQLHRRLIREAAFPAPSTPFETPR